jgi:hypothetical protein
MNKGNTKGGIFLMGVLALAALSPAQRPPRTDPGAYVPGPNMPMPNYFTGTYNWVQGYVKPLPPPNPTDPPTQLKWIKLHVNGQEVKHIVCDPNIIHLAMQISAVVDSTHFSHGSTLTVTVTAMDEHYRFYTDSDSAPVTNVFRGFEHHDAATFLSPLSALTNVGISGYGFQFKSHFDWPEAAVEAAQTEVSAALFATHGLPAGINADPPASNPPEFISAGEVQSARVWAHGVGLSPFNTGAPRTQIVVTLSCATGNDPDWYLNWFYPYWNSYNEFLPNQAGHGYTKTIFFSHMHNHVEYLFSYLRNGMTVAKARDAMIYTERSRALNGLPPLFPIQVYSCTEPGCTENPTIVHMTNFDWAPVHGDPHAKLKGVYTGDSLPTLDWFR